MRTPFVTRHTTPRSGFVLFFRFPGPHAVDRRFQVLTCLLGVGARPCGGPTPCLRRCRRRRRWQSRPRTGLCDLASLLSPPTGLGTRRAAPAAGARERQVRARGSPRQPWTPHVVETRARARVPAQARAPGSRASAPLEHRSSIHAACCCGSVRRANTGKL
jgi:hypothetical protein